MKNINLNGLIVGALAFVCIGIWHPIVIKGEYHLGSKVCAPIFGFIGSLCMALSMGIKNTVASTVVAIFGISAIWGIGEVKEQEKRVARGWFPANPKRQK